MYHHTSRDTTLPNIGQCTAVYLKPIFTQYFLVFAPSLFVFPVFFPVFDFRIPKKIAIDRIDVETESTEAFSGDPRPQGWCLECSEVALRSTARGGGFGSKSTQGRQGRHVERC